MNRTMAVTILLLAAMTASSAQSLGDRARELRKNKRTTTSAGSRVYTNESVGMSPASRMTSSDAGSANNSATSTQASSSGAAGKKEGESEGTGEDKAKAAQELRDEIGKAKEELATLQRELDVSQRENRLRAAYYYGDAGNRLRDEKKYAEDDRKYQAEAAGKQKAIVDAQKKLDDLREQARRAGIPPGQTP